MTTMEIWEMLSYVVTVVGLPFAILVFVWERRKERENDDEEVYQLLSDSYNDFLKLVLENPDLKLRSAQKTEGLNDDQKERMAVILDMLINLFERAYLLSYDDQMTAKQARRWASWEDYMREWCHRADFRAGLTELLKGEDPEFVAYFNRLAVEESQKTISTHG